MKIENLKLKIVFFGTPDYVDPIIKSLDKNFDLIKTVRSPSDSFDSLTHLTPDLFVVASFGKIIPREILEIPKLGAINIHPSKLPKYRGPSPIQSQILDGVDSSAISFILMDHEMDHGPIIYQEPYQINSNDTFESLCIKMFGKSAEILPKVIQDLAENKITPRLQDHAIAEYCNLVKKEDGYFDLPAGRQVLNPEKLDRMIRAFYPWPGAWTLWKNKIVKLLPNPAVIPNPPVSGEGSIETKQISHSVRNDKDKFLIQMEGKNVTDLKSFLNGYPDFPLKNIW